MRYFTISKYVPVLPFVLDRENHARVADKTSDAVFSTTALVHHASALSSLLLARCDAELSSVGYRHRSPISVERFAQEKFEPNAPQCNVSAE